LSGATSRFNEKRVLIAEELAAIETAYLRVRLLSQRHSLNVNSCFGNSGLSIGTYRKLPNVGAAEIEMAKSKKLQKRFGQKQLRATWLPNSHAERGKLLLPALNSMIDIQRSAEWRANPSPEYHLWTSVQPRPHLLATGWLPDGNRPASKLAAHIKFRSHQRSSSYTSSLMLSIPRAGLIRSRL